MLDFLGTFATIALIVFVVGALLVFLDLPRPARLWLAGALGLWVGVAAAGSPAGWAATARPFPLIGLFVVAPLLAAAAAARFAPARRAMLGLPLTLLVGLNVGRAFAVLFLLLEAEGRLSGPFPQSAAWGDIITGLVAIPLLGWARDPARHATALHLWNAFGMLDLVAAIGLGVMSADGSRLQVFPGPGSEAMQHLPWSFVPTVLVPLWMILHAIVFAKLRQAVPTLSPSPRGHG
ncbi:hypothetical protein [Reyranella sp.]|uniref:hypothetical protein n=1 Tax=Reyranella sp. TaxID=1929291 RepID=UPI003BADA185